MREINALVIHCSASKPSADIGVNEIRQWHLARGFSDIGYHFVIRRNGVLEHGRPIETPGAHVEGHNANTIGICLVGGVDHVGRSEDNFTDDQFTSLRELLSDLRRDYPDTDICGHRDFPGVHKDCPCFDVRDWCRCAFDGVE